MKKIIISTLIVLTIGGCSQFKYPDLGNGYKFEYHSKYTLEIVDSTNTVLIDMCILEYGFDSTFIVVSQRPWDIPNVPGLKEMTYDKRNEAFEKSTFIQYWIINKKEKCDYSLDTLSMRAKYSNVYGPYTKIDYFKKREKLNISNKLQLSIIMN